MLKHVMRIKKIQNNLQNSTSHYIIKIYSKLIIVWREI